MDKLISTSSNSAQRINTTLGDLICAINDAAQETAESELLNEVQLVELTQLVLRDLLNRFQQ